MKKIKILFYLMFLIATLSLPLGNYMLEKEDPEFIVDLMELEPEKISISMSKNNEAIFEFRGKEAMPLASIFKIMIAIELVNQYSNGAIDLNDKISISEIERYNLIPRINPTHDTWLKEIVKDNEMVSINEIAKGMITYSSNPNTDYLIKHLGLDNINKTIKEITNFHTKIYPILAAALVPHYLMENGVKEDALNDTLIQMDDDKYEQLVLEIDLLIELGKYPNDDFVYPSKENQKILSMRLPKSTTADYVKLSSKLNTFFQTSYYNEIFNDLIMINKNEKQYIGGKKGETINVINRFIKVNDGLGETNIAIFTKNLDFYERIKVYNNIDFFIKKVLEGEYILEYKS